MTRPYELLVFDWDGTLMDSVGTIVACTQEVVRELGLPEPAEETIRGTIGLGLRDALETLYEDCDDELYGRIVGCYRRLWHEGFRDRPVLFPGVAAMLSALAAEGYLLAVATGKSRRGLELALDQSGVAPLFHATRTADEAFSKPHPQMLLDILDELGVRPAEAVMIGDSAYDLAMARAARTAALGVLSGSHPREELERLAPLACLGQVTELPGWLMSRCAGEQLVDSSKPAERPRSSPG